MANGKSKNLTMQELVRERLAARNTWVLRSDLVQSLLKTDEYKNRPSAVVANAISTALGELKSKEESISIDYDDNRWWHYVGPGMKPEAILGSFDALNLGLDEKTLQEKPKMTEPTELKSTMNPVDLEIMAVLNLVKAPKIPELKGKSELIDLLGKVGGLFTANDPQSQVAERLAYLKEFLGQFPDA